MKNKRIKNLVTEIGLMLASILICSCSIDWFGDIMGDLKDETSTIFTFYASSEAVTQESVNFTEKYEIGRVLDKKDLPQESDERVTGFKTGYEIIGWKIYMDSNLINTTSYDFFTENEIIQQITVTPEPADLLAIYKPRSDTKYTVKYWTQNKDRTDYELYKTETFKGTTDTQTQVEPILIAGFSSLPVSQKNIASDGSAVVDVYYDRIKVKITISDGVNTDDDYEGYYGQLVSDAGYVVPDRSSESYIIDKWIVTYADGTSTSQKGAVLTFPEKDAVCTADWKLKTEDASGDITNPLQAVLSFEIDATKLSIGVSHVITVKAYIDSVPVQVSDFDTILNPEYTITSYGFEQTGFVVGTEKNTITIPATFGYGKYEINITGSYNGIGYSATCDFEIE